MALYLTKILSVCVCIYIYSRSVKVFRDIYIAIMLKCTYVLFFIATQLNYVYIYSI